MPYIVRPPFSAWLRSEPILSPTCCPYVRLSQAEDFYATLREVCMKALFEGYPILAPPMSSVDNYTVVVARHSYYHRLNASLDGLQVQAPFPRI